MLKYFLLISIMLNAYLALKLDSSLKMISSQEKLISNSDYYFSELAKQQKSENDLQETEEVLNPKTFEDNISTQMAATKKPDLRNPEAKDYEHYDVDVQSSQADLERRVLDFFNYELSLDEDQVKKYFTYKKELLEKSSAIFTPPENFKDGDTYSFNQEEDFQYKKLLMEQLQKLKKTIGEKKYRAYQKFKNSYNKKVLEQAQYGQPVYIMEF